MTPSQPDPSGRPAPERRRSHLIDPDAPRPVRDPDAERRVLRVQQWVVSSLAVVTTLHLSAGLIIAGLFLEDATRANQVVLDVIAGLLGAASVAAWRAIHGLSVASWWLLVGFVPITAVGLVLTYRLA